MLIAAGLEILHVLAVRSERWRASAVDQHAHQGVDFVLTEHQLLERLDVTDKAMPYCGIGGHPSLGVTQCSLTGRGEPWLPMAPATPARPTTNGR